jgi:hypothetical protein
MTGKIGGPPKGQPWVWLTRELVNSAAWRGLGINARRLVDFLMIENMDKGGRENGFLLAPREQLIQFGIGRRHITGAILEAELAGIIDVKRGTGRRASTYALRWLPTHVDGIVHEGELQEYPKVNNKRRSSARRDTATAQNKGIRRCTPLKNSYHGSSITKEVERALVPPVVP